MRSSTSSSRQRACCKIPCCAVNLRVIYWTLNLGVQRPLTKQHRWILQAVMVNAVARSSFSEGSPSASPEPAAPSGRIPGMDVIYQVQQYQYAVRWGRCKSMVPLVWAGYDMVFGTTLSIYSAVAIARKLPGTGIPYRVLPVCYSTFNRQDTRTVSRPGRRSCREESVVF